MLKPASVPTTAADSTPRWLRCWAVLTVCATCLLLLLGAEVTTRKVGMVDPRGFRMPWHLLEVSWLEKGLGYLIEHSHRLAGFVVGTCAIVLAVGMWLQERRPWCRPLGLVALGLVIVQGLLGIFRIELNALMGTNLALVHGLFAQLVFALLVSVAVFTSQSWQKLTPLPRQELEVRRLAHTAFLTLGLVYTQIILGALVRHHDYLFAARAHLVMAFVVTGAIVWLLRDQLTIPGLSWSERITGCLLALLLAVQLLLGVESWLSKFAVGAIEWRQLQPLAVQHELLRTIHFFTGSLVLATVLTLNLQVWRRLPVPSALPASELPQREALA